MPKKLKNTFVKVGCPIARVSGVYEIECSGNGMRYIGSSININFRIYMHRYMLARKEHPNKVMQDAYKAYGPRRFVWRILVLAEKDQLKQLEQEAMDEHDFDKLFNACPSAFSPKGLKHRPEAIANFRGRPPFSEEVRRKISIAKMGKVTYIASPKTKEKIRKAKLLRWGCPQCGFMSNDSGVTMHQRAAGHTDTPSKIIFSQS